MIEGVVNATYEAVVSLSLRGAEDRTRDIEAAVDTGYSGFLTVPPAMVAELGLPFAYVGRVAAQSQGSHQSGVPLSSILGWNQTR